MHSSLIVAIPVIRFKSKTGPIIKRGLLRSHRAVFKAVADVLLVGGMVDLCLGKKMQIPQ